MEFGFGEHVLDLDRRELRRGAAPIAREPQVVALLVNLARNLDRVVSEDDIKLAIFTPPETTRAFFRGRSVARFNDEIASIQWDEIVFAHNSQSRRVALPEASIDARLNALNHAARNGKDFDEFMAAVSAID